MYISRSNLSSVASEPPTKRGRFQRITASKRRKGTVCFWFIPQLHSKRSDGSSILADKLVVSTVKAVRKNIIFEMMIIVCGRLESVCCGLISSIHPKGSWSQLNQC